MRASCLCVGVFALLITLPGAFGETLREQLEQLYNQLDLTMSPPPQNRSLAGPGNPKIDPLLLRRPEGGVTSSRGMGPGTVAVIVLVRAPGDAASLRGRITAQGGTVGIVEGRTIYCDLPVSVVPTVAGFPEVTFISAQPFLREPPKPEGMSSRAAERGLMAAGVDVTHVSLLHRKGIRGEAVKVGILDFGFSGYADLQQRGILPPPKAAKAFNSDGKWDRGPGGEEHGTACAEIVHAVAPEAEIYIAAAGEGKGDGGAKASDIIRAANWLMEQGVDIISHSGGGHSGAHNGRTMTDEMVEKANQLGILWVNAAGNEGNKHWTTLAQPASQGQHVITDMAGNKDFLLFFAKGKSQVMVNWDDWGDDPRQPHSSQDFNVVLNGVTKGRTTYLDQSNDLQTGAAGSIPREVIDFDAKDGGVFALFITARNVTKPVRVHVYLEGGVMYPYSPAGSIGIPAASPLALSVGAVNVDNSQLEAFSSQGPTDDGRAKPDVAGPDRVFSEAYKDEFPGTSAACPFVAGFAALVRQMRGKLPAAELKNIIIAATTPLANNAGAGRGMIDAAKLSGVGGGGSPSPISGGGGTTKPIRDLLQLARTDNPLGVKIVTGHREYRVGDGLKAGYRVEQDAYCLVVRKTASGQIAVLQPAASAQLHLTPGSVAVYPRGPQQTIRLTGAGSEQVGMICSASPIRPDGLDRVDPNSLSVDAVSYQIQ